MKFTDTFLSNLKPKASPYRIFEKGEIKGFGVQVSAKGIISYFLCYAEEGKTKYRTFAQFPTLKVAQAKEEAKKLRHRVDLTQSLSVKQQGTVEDLFEGYLSAMEESGKRSVLEVRRTLTRDALPVLGADTLAKEVTPQHIRQILFNCIERGAQIQANRIRSILRAAFQFGLRFDHDPASMGKPTLFDLSSNPVDVIPTGYAYEKPGERVLTLEELRFVWNEVPQEISIRHHLIFKLIILFGGLRPSEVTQMEKKEIDLAGRVWAIPPERTKNKRWHTLPLVGEAYFIFAFLLSIEKTSNYLFPGRHSHEQPEYRGSIYQSMSRFSTFHNMEHWSVRDLRRTCKTWAGKAGLSKEIRDRLLNHALNDVSAKHYDRYLYLREKEAALIKWEAFLTEQGFKMENLPTAG